MVALVIAVSMFSPRPAQASTWSTTITHSGPATVEAGTDISYAINWAVIGDAPVTNATIIAPIPDHTGWVWSDSFGAVENGRVIWRMGSKGPGSAGVLYLIFHANVPVTNGTVVTSAVSFDTDQTNPVSHDVTTTITSRATLGLQQLAPDTVGAGQNLLYTYSWTVGGTVPATGLTLSDPLPSGAVFVSADNGGTLNNGVVTWNLGSKNPGALGSVHLTLRSTTPIANGSEITNSVTLDALETDPVVRTARTNIYSSPQLTVKKSSNLSSTAPGKTVVYTVTVANAVGAGATAENVTLTDTLPAGFAFTNGSGNPKTIAIGTLVPGASTTTSYSVVISTQQVPGTYANTIVAQGSNAAPVSAASSVSVRAAVVLAISPVTPPSTPTPAPTPVPVVPPVVSPPSPFLVTKTADQANAGINDIVIYTIAVKNTRTETISGVTIDDTFPAGMIDLTNGKSWGTWTVYDLEPGQTKSISFPIRITAATKLGLIYNTATVRGNGVVPGSGQGVIMVYRSQILGLATTGASPRDYGLFTIGGLLILIGGIIFFRQRQPESTK